MLKEESEEGKKGGGKGRRQEGGRHFFLSKFRKSKLTKVSIGPNPAYKINQELYIIFVVLLNT